MTITTAPAGPEHLDALARLAIAEQDRDRAADPRLGAPAEGTTEGATVLRSQLADLAGTVAIRDGALAGSWLAGPAGGAQAAPLHGLLGDPDALRAAYAAQAAAWVEAGHRTHTATVRVADAARHDALVDLGFGHEQAYAVLDLLAASSDGAPPPADVDVRPATAHDLDDVVRLAPVVGRHQVASPVFARVGEDFFDQLAEAHREELGDPAAHYLLARIAGDVVGFAIWYDGVGGPLVPTPSVELSVAATGPRARGRGVGLALTAAVQRDASERGARWLTADWRTTNLLASRFWPTRGFRVVGYRMARTVDPG